MDPRLLKKAPGLTHPPPRAKTLPVAQPLLVFPPHLTPYASRFSNSGLMRERSPD